MRSSPIPKVNVHVYKAGMDVQDGYVPKGAVIIDQTVLQEPQSLVLHRFGADKIVSVASFLFFCGTPISNFIPFLFDDQKTMVHLH